MTRVLIAAESCTDRLLLADILESEPNFEVVAEADNGVEAAELAVRLAPDLIAMDLDLPLLDGVETTTEIMTRAPTRIVIVSASENGPDLNRGADALRAGALTVVPKPSPFDSAQFNLRREIFLEMVRVAMEKVVGPYPTGQALQEAPATSWLRPLTRFVIPFSPDTTAPEMPAFDTADIFPRMFTVEDRAQRIRALLDEIEGLDEPDDFEN